ncbi:uncharacterized protein cenpv [Denticeps clupeoides]|uniref:CENP-V/GFA domain-containing protein n=1 Tax=Denticeps clupeoides TaxID=299321 RepID=A0AAY4EQF5_9TELE|nr:centromere protein V [Denticeps clupeoides]
MDSWIISGGKKTKNEILCAQFSFCVPGTHAARWCSVEKKWVKPRKLTPQALYLLWPGVRWEMGKNQNQVTRTGRLRQLPGHDPDHPAELVHGQHPSRDTDATLFTAQEWRDEQTVNLLRRLHRACVKTRGSEGHVSFATVARCRSRDFSTRDRPRHQGLFVQSGCTLSPGATFPPRHNSNKQTTYCAFVWNEALMAHGGQDGRNPDLVGHLGGCHCGAVRFQVWTCPDLHVFKCNCSICTKKQNHHFIVPKSQFTLLQGSDRLSTYTFNTHTAKHMFCRTCGVQSFYIPRSNPDGFGVAPHCLDPGTVRSVTVEDFCGENWEDSMEQHQTIRSMSQPRK